MLEPTQGCRARQIQTYLPTNITQGISAHSVAFFLRINKYWKKYQTFGKKQTFPQFAKKANNPVHPNLTDF